MPLQRSTDLIQASVYKEVVDQLPKEVKEYLCYLENGRLLVSKTHAFKPEVTGLVARLKRLNMPCNVEHVDLSVITETNADLSGNVTGEAASDMQRQARRIFDKAVSLRASDIHIRNTRLKNTAILMRIDGDLETVEEHSFAKGHQLCSTIYQAMTDISDPTFEPLSHQDARISDRNNLPSGVDGIRVATTPQVGGYIMVLRLLYNDSVEDFDLALLGYAPNQVLTVDAMKRRPNGVNIIAGPTGAGKSTTLQRALGGIIKETNGRKHVITVEDPPEYPIPGAVQTPVTNVDGREERSRAFEDSIRAAMRLDPDIIMIGEIRDTPSARLAMQAAMTGHQVWTTLHANNALAIIDRLFDLDVPMAMLTDPSVVTGLTCQRLVKRLCPECKTPLTDVLDRYSAADIQRVSHAVDIATAYVTGTGCDHCRQTGTSGRTVVAETIATDARLMALLRAGDRDGAKTYWLNEQGGTTMLGHAIRLVEQGEIDPFKAEDIVGPLNMESLVGQILPSAVTTGKRLELVNE